MKYSTKPVVVPCKGVSPTGQLVGDVADELERLGAIISREPEEVAEGHDVVALDGCSSGCSSRTLEASGVEPAFALDISKAATGPDATESDAKRIAAGVFTRLRRSRVQRPIRRSRSDFTAATAAMSRRQHTVEDYLLAIDRLGSSAVECGAVPIEAPTIAAHVSRLLAVTPVSVAQMINNLESDGLVRRSPSKSLVLTAEGRARADVAMRRQLILECMVTDFLGHTVAESFERAFMIGPSFEDDSVERAYEALGKPRRCPHGWPLDAAEARAENERLMVLSALDEDQSGRIVRISEDDRVAAKGFAAAGLELGDMLTLAGHDGLDVLTLRLDGANEPILLDANTSRAIFVEPV